MSIHISAEAACNHCGKTTPCVLSGSFMGPIGAESFAVEKLAVATRGLQGWFSWEGLLACSVPCKEALSQRPPFTDYRSSAWTARG